MSVLVRRRRPRARTLVRARPGFTLVELLIAMTLLTAVMSAMVATILTVQRDYARQRSRSDSLTALRSSELLLGRLFRTAGADPNNVGVVGIVANPNGVNDVRIRADFNPADGDVSDPLEDVLVDLNSGEMRIRWQAGGTMTPLIKPVSSLTFEYYRRDGTQLTNLAHADSAKRVKIVIEAPITNTDGSTATLRSESWAFVRN